MHVGKEKCMSKLVNVDVKTCQIKNYFNNLRAVQSKKYFETFKEGVI